MISTDWIRSPQSRGIDVGRPRDVVGSRGGLVVVDRQEADAAGQVGVPLTDEQAVEQVVGSARQIVAAARLQERAGGYTFVSCENENEPPYQAALYMSFVSAAQ